MINVQHFFHEATSTLTYIIHDGAFGIVIDPVRDYDPASGRISWASCDKLAAYIDSRGLKILYVIDSHTHADHMTALPYFRARYAARTVTGAHTGETQQRFRDVFNLGTDFAVDGSQFDVLIDEGERLGFGSLEIEAIHTPGHTPEHVSWQIEDVVFVGDTLFMPDYGSARCDFPGGSAAELYASIQRIYALPDATRLFMCHDYQPGGRPLAYQTTVAEQKQHNIQINARTAREDYIAFRAQKDATLLAPALLLPSLQMNIQAGELPAMESNGVSYLKIPLKKMEKMGSG